MKNSTSLETTLDQLVSDFAKALLEAALRAPLSEFAAATSSTKDGARSSLLSSHRHPGDNGWSAPALAHSTAVATRAARPPPGRRRPSSPAPRTPPQGDDAGPAHA